MNKKTKTILSSLFICGFLFTVSSCSGSKYDDGGICGNATTEGTNVFSQVRNYYIEQYVYELNAPTDEMIEKEDGGKYDLYANKYIVEENDTGITVNLISSDSDQYIDAHYLFTYYDNEGAKKYASAVESYVNDYATTNVEFTETDATNYIKVLDDCANADKSGYFTKKADKNTDGDADTSYKGTTLTSVQSRMQSHSKACIVFEEGFKDPSTGVSIPKTTWKDAWNEGLLTGLLIYPLSAFISLFVTWFGGTGVAQMFAILVVTFILKLAIFLLTFKSQASTQKMQDIQPEILKIQAKYGQTPTPEQKQKMSMELMGVYKKYGVKPFAPFVSLLITFPVFISMYRAVMYLGILRTGTFFGVTMGNNLSEYIIGSSAFNWAAFLIFIIMAASQILSMKLPQFLNRKRMTEEAKKQQSSTNMMTNVMMIMILVMGFTMPVTMSVYWISSAIASSIQAAIMHKANNGGTKGRYKVKKVDDAPIDIPQGYKI